MSLISLTLAVLLVSSVAAGQTGRLGRAEDVLDYVKKGDPDRIASAFRYFQESVGPEEASKDQRIVRRFVVLVIERLGRIETY